MQIGTVGTADIPLPVNQLMVKEINFRGSMRYGDTFDEANPVSGGGTCVDARAPHQPYIFALDESAKALHFAADKTMALKVQIQP